MSCPCNTFRAHANFSLHQGVCLAFFEYETNGCAPMLNGEALVRRQSLQLHMRLDLLGPRDKMLVEHT